MTVLQVGPNFHTGKSLGDEDTSDTVRLLKRGNAELVQMDETKPPSSIPVYNKRLLSVAISAV